MLKIFVDFDGTITRQDVGDLMFETFGGKRSLDAVEKYRMEKLSAVGCFREECDACGEVDKTALDSFLDECEIDSSFIDFVAFCRDRRLDYTILSDGMDYYIKRILTRHGVGDVPFFSNKLELVPVGNGTRVRFESSFPHTDEVCDRCACCKRNHMLTLSSEEDIIVYVGEGYSDRCPVRFADLVFAKDDLLRYCRQENITCYEYQKFSDVQERLQFLLDGSMEGKGVRIRKRRQAELARRDLFLGG